MRGEGLEHEVATEEVDDSRLCERSMPPTWVGVGLRLGFGLGLGLRLGLRVRVRVRERVRAVPPTEDRPEEETLGVITR